MWSTAHPTQATARSRATGRGLGEVETMGLEPTTPCLQSRCSSQLSYVPEGSTRLPITTGGTEREVLLGARELVHHKAGGSPKAHVL